VRSCLVTLLSLVISFAAQAELIRGELLNDDDPYFVRAGGAIYKVQWYSGSILFYEGDEVLLTTSFGPGKMIADLSDETADVWIERMDEDSGISLESIRRALTRYPMATPSPSVSAATPAPSVLPMATPTPRVTGTAIDAKWPDGRKLLHPDQFVRTRVVDVSWNDTLTLRAGPGTSFKIIAKIPGTAEDITAFGQDRVWDGDTWWCPIEWNGLRGYVGQKYLWKTR
jgi:hypothetical protein